MKGRRAAVGFLWGLGALLAMPRPSLASLPQRDTSFLAFLLGPALESHSDAFRRAASPVPSSSAWSGTASTSRTPCLPVHGS